MNATASSPSAFPGAGPASQPVVDASRQQQVHAPSGFSFPSSRLRGCGRLLTRLPALAGLLVWALLDILVRRPRSIRARCEWLTHLARRILEVLNINIRCQGQPPSSGLLLSNHLSYLDILVLAAHQPVVFVAKAEVRRWPLVGWLARLGGTQFIDRSKRADVARLNAALAALIAQDIVVVLFPEGTSSGGDTVLPFFSSLLAPAAEHHWPVTPVGLGYQLGDGSVEAEVCYWRDMSFLPHLLNLLTKRWIRALVHYGATTPAYPDRKALARQLQGQVRELVYGLMP